MRTTILLAVLAAAAAAAAPASQAQQQKPSFEVASIKRNTSRPTRSEDIGLGCHGTDSHSPGITIPLGRCISKFEPLRLLIALAYDIPPAVLYPYEGKVIAGPDWINSDIYDLEAKAEGPTNLAELKLMLQELLADRFQLKLHREMREMAVYALVPGKNSLKLKPAPTERECGEQRRRDHRYELGATSLSGYCHAFIPENGALRGQSVDMSDFAEMLSIWAGRIVVDKSGIQGLFDITMPRLTTADALQADAPKIAAGQRDGGGAPIQTRVLPDPPQTVFTALEPLGLRLESTKAPVEVIVIDNVQKPSDN